MTAESLAAQFRAHFAGPPNLYASLLIALADDLEAGGITRAVFRDHLDAPRSAAVHLRLLAGIQRLVLRGQAPALAPYYEPGATAPSPGEAAPALLGLLGAHEGELRGALDSPPQTNEVGRSAVLLVGLFEALRRHGGSTIRLLEPGASGGLNLNVDRYRFTGPGWAVGPEDSPLRIELDTPDLTPRPFTVVERRGCDLAPVAAGTPEGATYLASFVWPFDVDRRARLTAALEVAGRYPPTVDRAGASRWLAERLAQPTTADLTVVWQSITRQYWPQSESDAVDGIVDSARARMPIAQITMEGVPPSDPHVRYSVAEHGADLRVDGDLIARSHHHGPPVLLL